MKKILAVAVLLCFFLCGCGIGLGDILDQVPEKEYSHGDVTVSLPGIYTDYSNKKEGEGKDFLFAGLDAGITGVRENKQELYETFGQMDIQGYANLIAELYEKDTTAQNKDGYWTLQYEQEVDGEKWTYLCVFHETSSDYWNIQAYCRSEDFAKKEATLWKQATSIEITDNGSSVEELPEDTEVEETLPEPEEDTTEENSQPVTLNLPWDFLNYSGTEMSGEYDILYANADIGIMGIGERKTDIATYFGDKDLVGYAQLIADVYEIQNEVVERDGIPVLYYTADANGENYTYTVVFFETEDKFWQIQGGCLTEQFDQYEEDIWQYITSATFNEG